MRTKSHPDKETKVAVIGAGIVGLMTALEIQRTGRQVVVIDPGEPGGRQAASYGNAGWISTSNIMPLSVPGLWRDVIGYLLDKSGPFVIRWAYLPRLLPWLIRFVWAGRNWKKVNDCAKVRFELCRHSAEDHKNVAAEAGVGHLIEQKGQLYIYRDKSQFLAAASGWDMRRRFGIKVTELGKDDLRKLEPNISARYTCGVLLDDGCHCTDVKAYCEAIAELIRKRGGKFIRARATGFQISDGRLRAVKIGEASIECEQAVVTAGIGSKELAAAAGDRVSLESERGYHVMIADGGRTATRPIMPADGKIGITPMRQGLRIAGQIELASFKAAPDWRRADILHQFASRVFEAPFESDKVIDRWMGHRPATPDGLPCIGPTRSCGGLFYGFGHGGSGLAQAPATAKLLAALVAGQRPRLDVSPMSVRRF
ncbi:FAD-binding oxidoreductase [Bradyrhizobium sp. WSM 1738]|uniref:NAD(P)/FAD-dependent oxidoreductase n=1 Tax=Bradyrhizobium hereditatis TaxID=2821405 RepID=UPI001CE2D747|nr:FAD-binding oxidoreductase [Bradyrhizobium hereditatis]MCA6120209.1 FAD-binding oxidoreductase [Bradyrhizobium hereditatis]